MFPNKKIFLGILSSCMLLSSVGYSAGQEEVRFSKKELAKETTLPVFRNHKVVRSRRVKTKGRVELDLMFGKTLNDALFDTYPIVAQANYHWTEVHGFQLEFGTFSTAENSFVDAIRDARGPAFTMSEVPRVESQYSLLWEYTPYYGKISFSKQNVLNLSIYTVLGFGQLNYTGGSSSVIHVGFGQKLYFSKNWGMKLDLRGKMYEFADFPDKDKGSTQAPPFDMKNTFNMELTVGLIYLLPTF